jgi:hypothetical protein
VRTFSHLSVDCIASKYILKRYTRDHCIDTPFDRHDKIFLGPDEETTAQWTRTILSDLFKLQKSAIMSPTTMDRAKNLIATTITELDKIPHDVSLPVHRAPAAAASTSNTPQPTERMTKQEEHNVSASAPPVSTTKGSRKKYAGVIADIPQPHFQWDKRKKRRKCGRCDLYDTGHNAATCERAKQQLENSVVKRPRGRLRGGGRGNATIDLGMQ